MNIIRQIGCFSLVESSQSESKTLKYYIDNGEETTEYFDHYEKNRLLEIESDHIFANECASYF